MQETEHLFICFISTFCPKPSPTRLVGNSASAVLHCSPTLCKSPGVTRSSKEVGRAERTWCQGAWAPQAGLDCACSPLRSHRLPRALPGAPSSAETGAPTPAHRPTALCLLLQSRRTSLGPGRNCPPPISNHVPSGALALSSPRRHLGCPHHCPSSTAQKLDVFGVLEANGERGSLFCRKPLSRFPLFL